MTTETATPTHGYTADKEALIKRLHRIEGQVRGIEKMIEDERKKRRNAERETRRRKQPDTPERSSTSATVET